MRRDAKNAQSGFTNGDYQVILARAVAIEKIYMRIALQPKSIQRSYPQNWHRQTSKSVQAIN